ncbi:MAG: hypothetical protein PGN11_05885 [Quadrisphaera sp.]
MGTDELAAALDSLHRLLALVEQGDVECEGEQLLQLRGAEATLVALLEAQV